MDGKFLKITFAIFASLAVIVFFMWLAEKDKGEEKIVTKNLSVDLADFTGGSVNKIVIRQAGEERTLDHRDGKWYIGSDEADEEKVKGLFQDFSMMEIKETVSENEANHKKFQVTKEDGIELVLTQDGKETVFYVGKIGAAPTDFYIRKNSIKNVYLASGNLREKLIQEAEKWKKDAPAEETAGDEPEAEPAI